MSRHVAVLMGGWSAEREVSLVSGAAAGEALRARGYRVSEIDVGRDLPQHLAELEPDVVYNALHGRFGEDGTVQGLLEIMDIPYTHSGVLASSLAMNKAMAKRLFASAGLRSPEGFLTTIEALRNGAPPMAPPYVIKPNNEGSSVGVQIVRTSEERPARAQRLAVRPGGAGRALRSRPRTDRRRARRPAADRHRDPTAPRLL